MSNNTKRVMITGAAGFIGSNLVLSLLEKTKHEVIALDRLDQTVNLNRLGNNKIWNKSKRKEFVWWDLKAPMSTSVIRRIHNADIIVHLASQSHVDRSLINAYEFAMDNVIGTINLLDFVKDRNIKLIHVSTDEIFGSALEDYAFNTTDAPHPENPYAATKLGQEALVRAYACTWGIPTYILRLSNIIGPAQNLEKMIPKSIHYMLNSLSIPIHTSSVGRIATRYYLDVRDLISGIIKLIENDYEFVDKNVRGSGTYHFSGDTEVDNLTLITKLSLLLNKPLNYHLESNPIDRSNPDIAYRIDDTKTRELLDWKPIYNLDSSLNYIVDWYLSNTDWVL